MAKEDEIVAADLLAGQVRGLERTAGYTQPG